MSLTRPQPLVQVVLVGMKTLVETRSEAEERTPEHIVPELVACA